MVNSIDWGAYVETQAALLGLLLDDARKAEVALHLSRIAAMVEPLLEFEEDRAHEPAPVFRP